MGGLPRLYVDKLDLAFFVLRTRRGNGARLARAHSTEHNGDRKDVAAEDDGECCRACEVVHQVQAFELNGCPDFLPDLIAPPLDKRPTARALT